MKLGRHFYEGFQTEQNSTKEKSRKYWKAFPNFDVSYK